jgi:transcriptional regulator with XRE-family HTH domain
MKSGELGLVLTRARRKTGLTQAEVAERLGTTQSVISRAEAGQVLPSLRFLERFAEAVEQPIVIEFRPGKRELTRRERRQRVRRATGNYVFNPWDRSPSEAEVKSLIADGLTREYFEGQEATVGVLYLDRLRQATVSDYKNDIHFMSALSVATARYEDIDWKYVKQRIKEIEKNEPLVGQEMRRRNSLIRRRARHTLAESG